MEYDKTVQRQAPGVLCWLISIAETNLAKSVRAETRGYPPGLAKELAELGQSGSTLVGYLVLQAFE
jgi:hypothetical protein